MAEAKIKYLNLGGMVYRIIGSLSGVADDLGISEERLVELLDRDAYTPVLDAAPTSSTLTYTDTDGSECEFRVGQAVVYPDSNAEGGYQIVFLKSIIDGSAVWSSGIPTRTSELENDSDFSTNAYVDGKDASLKSELNATINTVRSDLTASMNTVKTSLENSMAAHKTEVDNAMTTHEKEVDDTLLEMQERFETLITEHRDYMYGKLDDMQTTVEETSAAAEEAERVSYEASAVATQASTDAASAIAAVATLQGLADTTTAQETLAAQVTQIEENKQNILLVPNFELYKETEYDL